MGAPALEDLLGVATESLYDERLYRALDRVLPLCDRTARAELSRFAKELAEKTDWRQIREDIEVKICRGPDGKETFLLCRSASRVEKEKAMHERFSNPTSRIRGGDSR